MPKKTENRIVHINSVLLICNPADSIVKTGFYNLDI